MVTAESKSRITSVGVVQVGPSSPRPSTLWFHLPHPPLEDAFVSETFWDSSSIDLLVGSLRAGDVTFPSPSSPPGWQWQYVSSVFPMGIAPRLVLRATILHDMPLLLEAPPLLRPFRFLVKRSLLFLRDLRMDLITIFSQWWRGPSAASWEPCTSLLDQLTCCMPGLSFSHWERVLSPRSYSIRVAFGFVPASIHMITLIIDLGYLFLSSKVETTREVKLTRPFRG